MRQALVILLLVLLPFQAVWAAAAVHCQHEQGSDVAHFGHHAHKHAASVDLQPGDPSDDGGGSAEADCSWCHLACAVPLPVVPITVERPDHVRDVVTVGHVPPGLWPRAIDRPQWPAFCS